VENEDSAIVPLYSARYSQRAPDFQSENEEIKTAFRAVSAACGGRGVWVVDRGGDRGELYAPLLDAGGSPSSSATRARAICCRVGARWRAPTWPRPARCFMPLNIVREEKAKAVCHRLDDGFRPVRLADPIREVCARAPK